jgi:hypothetical protein
MDRYNVGYIQFGDENFGSDRRATEELIRLIKPLDILWEVAGVRARSVDTDLLKRMHNAGCVALYYGFESGSPDILAVMEKNLTLAHNDKAAMATFEAGLFTVYQLVLGMPGESNRTVAETIERVKRITEFLPQPPFWYVSINYIQALPGTPVYEYARTRGLIRPGLSGEDEYLTRISDINASDDTKFLNFTRHPYLVVRTWRPRIIFEAGIHWYRNAHKRHGHANRRQARFAAYDRGGYFNLVESVFFSRVFLSIFYPIRWIPIWTWTLLTEWRRNSFSVFARHVIELIRSRSGRRYEPEEFRSLRAIMRDLAPAPTTESEHNMIPLRLGR